MPPMNHDTWPDGTRRSTDNAFTLGWKGTPHGFSASQAAAPAKLPQRYGSGGFHVNNGTIPGMRDIKPGAFTIRRKRELA